MNRRGLRSLRLLLLCAAGAGALPRLPAASAPRNEDTAQALHLTRFVVPEFPVFLRQIGLLQGTVVVALAPDDRGRADDLLVLESTDPRFTAAVLEAMREWRFDLSAATPPPSPLAPEPAVPVVRFLFTSGSVSIVPLAVGSGPRRRVQPDTPVELPNFSHCDAPPKEVHQPMPAFPASLPAASGHAVVKFFVDTTGRARLPIATQATAPEFATAAVAAVRQWRFEPPRIDGKPAVVLERRFFEFRRAAAP